MKAQTKALIASVMVIALALTAVSGVTYSWFSDEDEATIDISTAAVDYKLEGLAVKTDGYAESADAEPADTESDTDASKSISLINFAPGDVCTITPEIVDLSTIDTIYRVYVTWSAGSDPIQDDYFEHISINGKSLKNIGADGKVVVQTWTSKDAEADPVSFNAKPFTLAADQDLGNSAQKKSFTLTVTVEAYQGSYVPPIDEGGVVIPEDGMVTGEVTVSGTDPGSEETAEIAAAFPKNVKGTFEASVAKSDDRYTISATLNGAGATFDDPVTMTVTLKGNLGGANVIYLGTSGEQPEDVSAVYDGSANTTTITFTTTHFSDFAVVAGNIVAIADLDDGTVGTYTTLAAAVAAAKADGTVVLVKDVDLTEAIAITKDVTLDLNGKDVTSTTALVTYGKSTNTNLTIKATGSTITADYILFNSKDCKQTSLSITGGEFITNDYSIVVYNMDSVTLEDVTINDKVAAVWFGNSGAKTVEITGGSFTGTSVGIYLGVVRGACTISGAAIEGATGIEIKSGADVKLENCTITGTGAYKVPGVINHNGSGAGVAPVVINNGYCGAAGMAAGAAMNVAFTGCTIEYGSGSVDDLSMIVNEQVTTKDGETSYGHALKVTVDGKTIDHGNEYLGSDKCNYTTNVPIPGSQ